MKFSLWAGAAQPWDDLLAEVVHAEASGWDGVWLADHFLPVDGGVAGSPDECLALLAGLAASVPRVRLGSLVCGNTYRHPGILAKAAATVDRISGGRVVLGLGAGWQQNEHDAFGIELPPVKRRLDMFEEACELVHGLLSGEEVSFAGAHYRLDQAVLAPAPVQQPVPLLVGGGGEKRMLRIVARWADEWNTWGPPGVLAAKGKVLDQWCEQIGRDPASIHRSAQVLIFHDRERDPDARFQSASGTTDELQQVMQGYVDAGVGEFIVRDMTFGAAGAERDDGLDRFLGEVAAPFRD
jgi:F420-dependent oxidoreductase-like protein